MLMPLRWIEESIREQLQWRRNRCYHYEQFAKSMMKQYKLYVFTQDSCPPCHRLKKYVERLTEAEKAELDFVPLKTATGARTSACRGTIGRTLPDTRCRP